MWFGQNRRIICTRLKDFPIWILGIQRNIAPYVKSELKNKMATNLYMYWYRTLFYYNTLSTSRHNSLLNEMFYADLFDPMRAAPCAIIRKQYKDQHAKVLKKN